MELGAKIKQHIEENGIKKSFVAGKANIKRPIFTAILNCTRQLQADEFIRICKAINVPIENFIGESEEGEYGDGKSS